MIVQHDIGSAQQVNAPKYLICAHQTKDILLYSIILIYENIMLKQTLSDILEIVYLQIMKKNDHIEQYKNLKLFFFKNISVNHY